MPRALALVALLLTLLGSGTAKALADCPTGYEFSRRFIGCVQTDCGTVEHAHLSYTGGCVCGSSGSVNENPKDPNRECARPADYASCPRCVYQCVHLDERCPGEIPTQKQCDERCREYHGTHAAAKPTEAGCDCSCADGYLENGSLVCVPSKETCDQSCREYHGTDRLHGPEAEGHAVGTECECSCAEGYLPDESLTCKPAPAKLDPAEPPEGPSCEDKCVKWMGEGAIPSEGLTTDDCWCTCKKTHREVMEVRDGNVVYVCTKKRCFGGAALDEATGECVCPEPFYPKPFDQDCIPKRDGTTCGNGTCDGVVPYGDPPVEDCRTCAQDCACKDGTACDPDTSSIGGEYGCHKAPAEITGVECGDATIVRKSGAKYTGQAGRGLQAGDVIIFQRHWGPRLQPGKKCSNPWIELEWDGTKGRMYLGSNALHGRIEIGKDAVTSGWPSRAKEVGDALWEVTWELIKTTLSAGPSLIFSSSTMGDADDIRIYVNSRIVVRQRVDTVSIFTHEGEPDVEYRGEKVTVNAGQKVTISGGKMTAPESFDEAEADWTKPPVASGSSDSSDGGCIANRAVSCLAEKAGVSWQVLVLVLLGVRRRRQRRQVASSHRTRPAAATSSQVRPVDRNASRSSGRSKGSMSSTAWLSNVK